MSPNQDNNDDISETNDDISEAPSDQSSTLLKQFRAIIEALAQIEEEEGGHRRGSGQVGQGGTRIAYGYDVSIGLGLDDRTASLNDQPDSNHSQTKKTTLQQRGKESSHIETREVDDGLVVVADLLGVTEDDEVDVTLDTDESALELTAGEEVIERVALDYSNLAITDVNLNNQVLEIRLTWSREPNGEETE